MTSLIAILHVSVYDLCAMYQQSKRRAWNAEGVKALRKHLGYTQRRMADELGARQQTISEWETGMYKPRGASARLLSMIAEHADFEYGVGEKTDEMQNVKSET
jgi:DNA-binding transcriptional regulator YiaG